ncbi:hypothetical protein WA026_015586 [Henosepilachna vigintioctopunctata]|uniref:MD-2-related lipid-recognition domain-containing protein n=1 Tax=Henosepilachna vigintioctopunctata TaxID=420089 RepID=A0AAW1V8X8_9CUCU
MFTYLMKLSLLLLLSVLVGVQCAYFYDCEDTPTLGKVQSIKVTNCDSNEPDSKCRLKRGTNITFDLTFKTDVESDTLKAVVHGVILGEEKSFKLPNDNGCVDCGITCPITKDSVQTYSTDLAIQKWYPKVSVDVKWELQNKEGKDIWCVIIPAKLA